MIKLRMESLFFDDRKVMRAVERGRRKALSRAGAFIRQTAKDSMRRRKGPAPPGKPPHVHKGHLRRLVFFGYDKAAGSVVIGPARMMGALTNAPHTLEFGGATTIRERVKGKRRHRRRRRLTVHVEARPYMGPSLQKNEPKLPKAWANSVKG